MCVVRDESRFLQWNMFLGSRSIGLLLWMSLELIDKGKHFQISIVQRMSCVLSTLSRIKVYISFSDQYFCFNDELQKKSHML